MKKHALLILMLVGMCANVSAGYDPYNGRHYYTETSYNGRSYIARDCTLKNGNLISDYKAYSSEGKPEFVIKPQKGQWVVELFDYDGKRTGKVTLPAQNLKVIEDNKSYVFYGKGECTFTEYSMELDGMDGQPQEQWTKISEVKGNNVPVIFESEGLWDGCVKLNVYIDQYALENYDSKQVSFYSDDATGAKQHIVKKYTQSSGGVITDYTLYFDDGKVDFSLEDQGSVWMYQDFDQSGNLIGKLAVSKVKGAAILVPYEMVFYGVGTYPHIKYDEVYESVHYKTDVTGQMAVFITVIEDANECATMTIDVDPEQLKYLMGKKVEKYIDDELDEVFEFVYRTDRASFVAKDPEGKVWNQGTYLLQYNTLVGEYKQYSYWLAPKGKVSSELTVHFAEVQEPYNAPGAFTTTVNGLTLTGMFNGDFEEIEYDPDTEYKTVKKGAYRYGTPIGRHTKHSYYEGTEQLDEFSYFNENGEREGLMQAVLDDDSLLICSYHNNNATGMGRIYHDGGMDYRKPRRIVTDTTQLTLVLRSEFKDGKAVGQTKRYYPCYYTDEKGLRKGAHAGELYVIIDYDKGVSTQYSWFDTKYDDQTYTKGLRTMHFDVNTLKMHGLYTQQSEHGNTVFEVNYDQGVLDGWATYNNLDFCPSLRARFSQGLWKESQYRNKMGELLEIKRIDDGLFMVDNYGTGDLLKSHRVYNAPSLVMNQFDEGAIENGWFDLMDMPFIYETGEYILYDVQGREVEKGVPDGQVTYNDYAQKVSYIKPGTDEADKPITYYVLGTEYLYSGKYTEDLGNNLQAIYSIKKGLRDGEAKIVDTGTRKTIQKIKYSKGQLKEKD